MHKKIKITQVKIMVQHSKIMNVQVFYDILGAVCTIGA